jgi:hypothetical protein
MMLRKFYPRFIIPPIWMARSTPRFAPFLLAGILDICRLFGDSTLKHKPAGGKTGGIYPPLVLHGSVLPPLTILGLAGIAARATALLLNTSG